MAKWCGLKEASESAFAKTRRGRIGAALSSSIPMTCELGATAASRYDRHMPIEGDYEPSAWKFAADQVALYEATGGAEGGTLQGKPVIILTTRGRHSGKVRKAPLMRVEHNGTYAVVASMGGAPKHPVWYLNLIASPAVTLQDRANVYEMLAREVRGDEKARWWALAVAAWPAYAEYQTKTDRQIPVVVLERTP
jgi:deazaflavin-dependent oxidoreductase (nitroreductase family)